MNEETVNTLVHNIVDTKICIKNLTEHKKELEESVIAELGEGSKFTTPDGYTVVVTRSGTRTSIESKAVREKFPDVYNACIKKSVLPPQVRITNPGKKVS